jgi:hypothetical protein
MAVANHMKPAGTSLSDGGLKCYSMIRKSGHRFFEKIMLKQSPADKSDSTKSNRIYRVKVTNAKGTKP